MSSRDKTCDPRHSKVYKGITHRLNLFFVFL